MKPESEVSVIIAARNAASTIIVAIKSALRESQVAEVFVVDDASTDATAAAAQSADDGSGRLRVISVGRNIGPSAARNLAIAETRAPLVALLDADDCFVEGRFRTLLGTDDWDLVADNIIFVPEARSNEMLGLQPPTIAPAPYDLNLETFVEGNISVRGVNRGELGFLKPVMRRSFLNAANLRYDEHMRLGEDYALYSLALAAGARFRVIHSCGYVAMVRSGSLSGQHATKDLALLAQFDGALCHQSTISSSALDAVRRHKRQIIAKHDLRHFLDLKAQVGPLSALAFAAGKADRARSIARGLATDKIAMLRNRYRPNRKDDPQRPRYLLRMDEYKQ